MPAVFQIVSRSSGNALARSVPEGDYAQTGTPYIMQAAQDEQDPTQMWVLTPQDSSQDFLIQPFGSPGLAMGVLNPLSETEYPNDWVILPTATQGQVWRISRRLANPPYFFLLEANNDLLMEAATVDDSVPITIASRTEHNNQQWTFLPVFAQLGKEG
ncbi:MAG: hypothetical protein WCD11_03040 [Solirubrobacteraceae bacterium]